MLQLRLVGVAIPPLLVFTLKWHWVYSVFFSYVLSGLGLGIFEVTFLSVITPLGKAGHACPETSAQSALLPTGACLVELCFLCGCVVLSHAACIDWARVR